MPDYTRGNTTDPMSPPNPQGQAKTTNEMADGLQLTPEENALVGISGRPAQAPAAPPIQSDRHKLMFAPTDRPNEPVTHGMTPSGRIAPPDDIMDWAPYLREAAMEPDAPASVRALWEAIVMQLAENR